jgi:holo-[acyl-carrier protein] synthase
MIYGIGVDLLRIDRGDKLWQRHRDRIVDKLLHPAEKAAFNPDHNPGRSIARAFAAKEAFVKALGTGFRGVGFKEVGAVREPDERPRLVVSDRLAGHLASLGVDGMHLSFSDEAGMIVAFVVLERGQ